MLRLDRKLKDEIEWEGVIYRINASFNVILKLFELLNDDRLTPTVRINVALELLLGTDYQDIERERRNEVLRLILDKYVQTRNDVEYDLEGNPMPTQQSKQYHSLVHDAELIYAAFMQAYGIDLIDMQDKLHWLKFKALLNALPDDTAFSRIVSIRSWTPAQDKKKRNQTMREAQRRYALPGEKIEGEEEEDE